MIMIMIMIIVIVMIIVTIKGVYYKMETIVINTENSKTNEPRRFKLDLVISLILKIPRKTWL